MLHLHSGGERGWGEVQLSLKLLKGFSNEQAKCSPKLLMDFYLALIYNCAAAASVSVSASAIHMWGFGLGVWSVRGFNSNRKKALISNGTWMPDEGRDMSGQFYDLAGQHLWHQSLLNKSLNRCKVQESVWLAVSLFVLHILFPGQNTRPTRKLS